MLLPVEAAQPRALDVHLASMEGDLAVGFPPAVRLPLPAPRMAGTTDRLRIVIHHLAKSLQAGSQAERLKARKPKYMSKACAVLLMGAKRLV